MMFLARCYGNSMKQLSQNKVYQLMASQLAIIRETIVKNRSLCSGNDEKKSAHKAPQKT
jgi:hypothetical protein